MRALSFVYLRVLCGSCFSHHLTDQTVRQGRGYTHWYVAAWLETLAGRRYEVQCLILRCPSEPLAAGFVPPFNHYFNCLTEMLLVSALLDLALFFQQSCQTPRLLFVGNCIIHFDRWRIWTRRILEGKHGVVLDFIEQRKRLLKIFFRLSGKTNDHVTGNADLAPRRLHPGNSLEILLAIVKPLHGIEHASRSALHR